VKQQQPSGFARWANRLAGREVQKLEQTVTGIITRWASRPAGREGLAGQGLLAGRLTTNQNKPKHTSTHPLGERKANPTTTDEKGTQNEPNI